MGYKNLFDGGEQGIIVDMDKAIAKKGNFTPIFQIQITHTEDFEMQSDDKIPNVIQTIAVIGVSYEYWHVTTSFDDVSIIILTTPGEEYTKWEKLLLPFDLQTWIFFSIIFGLAFMSTFLINQMKENIRNLFLGSSSKYPAYNVLGTFFGISQTREPDGNFARIILMFFILFCLVMRTAYQGGEIFSVFSFLVICLHLRKLILQFLLSGVLFEMMAADMRRKPPETIEDLVEMNFTLLDSNDNGILFERYIEEDQKPNMLNLSTMSYTEFFVENIEDSSKKLAFMFEDFYVNYKTKKLGIEPNRIKKRLMNSNNGISMNPNNFLFHLLSDSIFDLNSGGFPQFLKQLYLHYHLLDSKSPILRGPQVMTVDDLNYGFTIWIIASGVSVLGFFVEFLMLHFTTLKKNFMFSPRNVLGLILYLSILRRVIRNGMRINY